MVKRDERIRRLPIGCIATELECGPDHGTRPRLTCMSWPALAGRGFARPEHHAVRRTPRLCSVMVLWGCRTIWHAIVLWIPSVWGGCLRRTQLDSSASLYAKRGVLWKRFPVGSWSFRQRLIALWLVPRAVRARGSASNHLACRPSPARHTSRCLHRRAALAGPVRRERKAGRSRKTTREAQPMMRVAPHRAGPLIGPGRRWSPRGDAGRPYS